MTREILLVDYENVQQIDLPRLGEGTDVVIFVGAVQKSIPIELVTAAQKLGPRVEWQRIEGTGKNALDFHIACHLGRILERSPAVRCVVLSKDKGFDPLLSHLNKIGLKCRRIETMSDAGREAARTGDQGHKHTMSDAGRDAEPATGDQGYKRVVEVLGKSEKKSRPRKRKTLAQYISSIFQKKISQPDIEGIIETLLAKKMISESNNTITYNF